jgi:hypothetical protein
MVIVKKVVDVGALRSVELEDYLAESRGHFAVITEFTTMEMFSGNPQVNVRKSLSMISKFPEQVILLKGNAKISKLASRSAGLQRRLQDHRKTRSFVEYCRILSSNGVANSALTHDIAGKGKVAREWRDQMTRQAESVRRGLANLADRIKPEDLKALRIGQLASSAFTDQVVRDIMGLTALHFRDVVRLDPIPSSDEALFTFPFRYAVCAYALSLKWVIDGGHTNAKSETLRNDYIDMTYSAYATFFDGLITKDTKLQELYKMSCWMLEKVFHINC